MPRPCPRRAAAAAVVSALTAKAKLAGMWREKVDQHNTGNPAYERIERVIVEHAPQSAPGSKGDGGAPELARSVMGVFSRVVPRAYSAVARLNSIATSSACNTHNSRYRCRQSATRYSSRRTVLRNADS